MTTKQFANMAHKITATNLFTNLKKGEHGTKELGRLYFGTTTLHYATIWRKYGTLENLIVMKTAKETNAILKEYGITEFIAKPTKNKLSCRLHEIKKINKVSV